MKKLATKNVFIDTSIFIRNSYGTNDKFKQLAMLANKGLVKIWVSEIILNELKRNIERDLNSSKDTINEYRRNLDSKARILKNIDAYKPYFELPKVNVAIDIKRFNENIESFVKLSKAQIIPHDLANINDIINNYFSTNYPFNKGDKKHEFPDAIVLSSIENWCIKNKKSLYVLSDDNDFLGYKSKYLYPTSEFNSILDILNRELESKERIDKIESLFLDFKSKLITIIESSFLDEYNTVINDFEINELNVISIDFGDYDITYIKEREAELEVIVKLKFYAEIEYDDYSHATHDNEDDVWYFVEKNIEKIEKIVDFPVTISVDLNPPAGPEFATIEISDIEFPSDLLTEELEGYYG